MLLIRFVPFRRTSFCIIGVTSCPYRRDWVWVNTLFLEVRDLTQGRTTFERS